MTTCWRTWGYRWGCWCWTRDHWCWWWGWLRDNMRCWRGWMKYNMGCWWWVVNYNNIWQSTRVQMSRTKTRPWVCFGFTWRALGYNWGYLLYTRGPRRTRGTWWSRMSRASCRSLRSLLTRYSRWSWGSRRPRRAITRTYWHSKKSQRRSVFKLVFACNALAIGQFWYVRPLCEYRCLFWVIICFRQMKILVHIFASTHWTSTLRVFAGADGHFDTRGVL